MEAEAKSRSAHYFMCCTFATIILLGFSPATVAQSHSRLSQAKEIAEVKAAEEVFRQSQLKYDTTAANAILADEFVGTWNHGERVDKRQFLSLIGDRTDPLEVLEYGEMVVRVYGDTAVVWSTIHEKAIYGGKPDEYRGRRTAIWVKRNLRWRCVTIHTSAFDQDTLLTK
jgi:ketosteroid isomerase-like protein